MFKWKRQKQLAIETSLIGLFDIFEEYSSDNFSVCGISLIGLLDVIEEYSSNSFSMCGTPETNELA